MPKPGAAPRQYRCKLCREAGVDTILDTFGELGRHRSIAHPETARSASPLPAGRETHTTRRIEDVSGPSDRPGEVSPEPSDGPNSPKPTGGRLRPSRPQLSQPSIRLSPEMASAGVADAVRDALPLSTLADLIRTLSVAVSEADGAGEAGYLSQIQCTQVAFLIHDSTIGFVVTRFEGKVDRFKLAMAVVVILASKGTIHARAIGHKIAQRQAMRPVHAPLPAPEAEPTGGPGRDIPGLPVPPEPEYADSYAEAAQRQQALMSAGMVQ